MTKTARSQRYRALEKELASLRRQLLPRVFSPTGAYPTRIVTKTVAYRVLVHAELEEYLEVRVWEIALASIKSLDSAGRVNRVIACLLAFCGQKLELPPTLAPPKGTQGVDWRLRIELADKAKSALSAFKFSIEQNNGIRERNILGLLLPVGIQPNQLDPTWLSTIDAFGQQRGLVAHHSAASYHAQHTLDPRTEFNTVKAILTGLRDVDDGLNRLSL